MGKRLRPCVILPLRPHLKGPRSGQTAEAYAPHHNLNRIWKPIGQLVSNYGLNFNWACIVLAGVNAAPYSVSLLMMQGIHGRY